MEPESVVINFLALIFGMMFIPLTVLVARFFGLFIIVQECEAHVYTLFGKVIGKIDQPGLKFPILEFGWEALLTPVFGARVCVSTALKQFYLRNQMVNSSEGTPMSVGIWYEMRVVDPVAYLFSNADPEGSLRANVISSAISTLSNLEMEKLLEDRHSLSKTVREAVSPLSTKWGYELGSVYIRKVGFTDQKMVHNITDKVVKRLVQVTSAMRQDGDNKVGLIKSETAKRVSQQLAEAQAAHPKVVGRALNQIQSTDAEILSAVLELREIEQLLNSSASVELFPNETKLMYSI